MTDQESLQISDDKFAQTLLKRIATIEKSRAQAAFLKLLDTVPIADQLVFRGGAALHGVQLHPAHRRFAADLDFVADSELVLEFRAKPGNFGLPLEHYVRPDGSVGVVYPYCGVTLKRLLVPVDVCMPHSRCLTHEPGMFRLFGSEERLLIRRVMPLDQLAAEKIHALTGRCKPVDVLDLWFCILEPRVTVASVYEIFAAVVSTETIDLASVFEAINGVAEDWISQLAPTLSIPIPLFDIVRVDLAAWLERFTRLQKSP